MADAANPRLALLLHHLAFNGSPIKMSRASSLSRTSWSSDSTDPIVVVVTGSSGFFGRHLIRELREEASSLGVKLHLRLYDRTTPYPTTPLNAYCATNAQAGRVILASDGTPQPNGGTLRALVLRPSGMCGGADPFLFPPMLNFVASKGQTPKIRIGGHTPSCQHAYAGNVAHAHAYVALRVATNHTVRSSVGGHIFFIVDQAPSNVFDLLALVVRKMGWEPPTTRLPDIVARTVGTITDDLTTLVSPVWSVRPKFTYSTVDMILTPRSVNGHKLKRETGWRPKYLEEEAEERTRQVA
ncbi:NAD(P)-binding protein [Gonapodya prolifera JEL478]|uniref:NAD(P)-binding protein n=1 Tax=Gonapodya prolifera (strain JEL478) TaxID=1344416 RepID=A0A139A6L1_GONPJ|nr:NAD(P)-binding protein [Gonapodya prolifera JEL478]|eukprot:KXS12447.1 NAD(P)-binding protein [Gonapodya prolifera JEL478]